MQDPVKQRIQELLKELVFDSDFTLAVVLRAIAIATQFDSSMRGGIAPNGCWYENGKVMAQWNLKVDYDDQDEPTKQFIGSLLGVTTNK